MMALTNIYTALGIIRTNKQHLLLLVLTIPKVIEHFYED